MFDRSEEGKKFFLEALSKIPKKFIDGKTLYTSCFFKEAFSVIIGNPKFNPMIYKAKHRRWLNIKVTD